MALEDTLVTLTNAIETMTVKLEQLNQTTEALRSLRADAIETVKNAAAPTASSDKKPGRKAKEVVEEEAPAAEQQEEAQQEQEPDQKADTLSDAVKEYISIAGDDKDERRKLAEKVKEIFSKVKATKRTEVPADKEAAVEKAIRKLIEEANNVTESEEDEDVLA